MENENDEYFGAGYAVSDMTPDVLKGKILNLIEILGLEESRERALKHSIGQIIYQEVEHASVELHPETYTKIRQEDNEKKAKSEIEGTLRGSLMLKDIS